MIAFLADCQKAERWGGKAAGLARAARLGFNVPKGMVIEGDFVDKPWPWYRYFRSLVDRQGLVAVRSSAVGEDGNEHSFAGQHATVLNVPVNDSHAITEAIRTVRDSLAGSEEYQAATDTKATGMAVIIQRMIPAKMSGVLFTSNPFNGNTSQSVLEWTRGLGDALVSGTVDPEGSMIVNNTNHEVIEGRTPRWMWQQVIDLGCEVEDKFEQPMDIEWAYTGRKVWLLQARPLTGNTVWTIKPKHGLAVGGGMVQAKAVWLDDEHISLESGEVLLSLMTDPHMIGAMVKSSGIVTMTGGRTCHAAIVARELNKPCVVGVKGLRIFKNHEVVVNGDEGWIANADA